MRKKNPYEKNIIKKCDVCEQIVMVDQYGNGKCEHCGWIQNNDEIAFEKASKVSYPNLVPLFRAREQYKKGLPFKATFEDFINGLMFYSEMRFEYKNKTFYVYIIENDVIELFEDKTKNTNHYKTKEEFSENAKINGQLLKDIWKDVKNAGFMYCG